MKLTQKDYDERVARKDTDEYSDEDRRLVKLYEREGFKPSPKVEKEADDEAEQEPGKYDALTPAQVKAEAKKRNLDVSGSNDEIVARLEEDDEKAQA